jgi:hypothetical protein
MYLEVIEEEEYLIGKVEQIGEIEDLEEAK